MNIFKNYVSSEREKRAKSEAYQRIRIEDYGSDVCITIDGIKARSITGNIEDDIRTLNELRNDFIKSRT